MTFLRVARLFPARIAHRAAIISPKIFQHAIAGLFIAGIYPMFRTMGQALIFASEEIYPSGGGKVK